MNSISGSPAYCHIDKVKTEALLNSQVAALIVPGKEI